MARDNFNAPVIRKLRERVATRCSNPECRVTTFAPSGEDGITSIGVAAHIYAASEGGPRYNSNMSKEQRKSLGNAIWLCSNCSIKIDRDIAQYPAELLEKWKNEAEESASEELGKKLPEENDAINLLTTAFTGEASRNIPIKAISNVHEANKKWLQALDPRFSIKSQYIEECSIIQLYPQEDISCTLDIKPEERRDFYNKHRALVEHGRELQVSTKSFEVEGSKLIEYITDSARDGKLTISLEKIPAVQKIWLVNKKTNAHVYLDDLHGHIFFGTKSFEFSGTAYSKLLTYKHTFYFDSDNGPSDFNFSFKDWEGITILEIPYFNKLFRFFEEIFKGSDVFTSLEINGGEEIIGSMESLQNIKSFKNIYTNLKYIKYSREISKYLKKDIKFTTNIIYTYEHFNNIHYIYKTIKGVNESSEISKHNNIKISYLVENAKEFKEVFIKTEPVKLEFKDKDKEEIEIFGTKLTLPKRFFSMEGLIPKVLGDIEKDIKDGDNIDIEYVPTIGYSCSISYEKN